MEKVMESLCKSHKLVPKGCSLNKSLEILHTCTYCNSLGNCTNGGKHFFKIICLKIYLILGKHFGSLITLQNFSVFNTPVNFKTSTKRLIFFIFNVFVFNLFTQLQNNLIYLCILDIANTLYIFSRF